MAERPEPVFPVAVHADAGELAAAAAARIVAALREALDRRPRASLLLSGGVTPLPTYARLAGEELPWARIALFWGDERCVGPDHPWSNYAAVERVLIAPARIPALSVHRMRGELPAARAALDYERRLREEFTGAAPQFDLALLGIGEDGHTASLFPAPPSADLASPDPFSHDQGRWVVPARAPRPPRDRVTLTYAALGGAAQTVFLVSGGGKAAALAEILGGGAPELPAARVARAARSVVWLIDRAAQGSGTL